MGFNKAVAATEPLKGGAVKMMIKQRNGQKSVVRIMINHQFATENLGIKGAGQKLSVYFGDGEQKGTFSLANDPKADIEVRANGKYGLAVQVDAWRGITNAKLSATVCQVATVSENAVICVMPTV